MFAVKGFFAVALMLGLAACGNNEPASRNLVMNGTTLSVAAQNVDTVQVPRYNVTNILVTAPKKLRVSEANVYYPLADIVWRGDVLGDRHAKITKIVQDGLAAGTKSMTSGQPIVLEVEITRFHAVTEKTRYSFGGTHSVKFNLTLRDAETGAVIDGPRMVISDIEAAGGVRAMAEDQAGRTQKVVIAEHLAEVIRQQLAKPIAQPAGALVSRNHIDPMRLGGQW